MDANDTVPPSTVQHYVPVPVPSSYSSSSPFSVFSYLIRHKKKLYCTQKLTSLSQLLATVSDT